MSSRTSTLVTPSRIPEKKYKPIMDKAFWSEVSHWKATDVGIFMPQVQIQDVRFGDCISYVTN